MRLVSAVWQREPLEFQIYWSFAHSDSSTICCDSRANSEIAQVRVKSKQEQAAYQASLRKEQMKVDSLERTLEQKVGRTSSADRKKRRDVVTHLWCFYRTKRSRS